MTWLIVGVLTASSALASLRWLRVAQREHYLTGSVSRFALAWWFGTPLGTFLAVVAVLGAVAAAWWLPAGLVSAAVVAVGPPGLGITGRTSALAWTERMWRLAGGVALALTLAAVAGLLLHSLVTMVTTLALPLTVDLMLAALAPIERRLSDPWVEKAAATLSKAGATVVAITGSYGKTTTKGYVAHLLGGSRATLASPASFNNRMGLARAINEHLSDGVDLFVAEMGAYGRGEIAELCSWIPPDVAVITAIGPVHLERFGSEEEIVAAKSEILEAAKAAVLNVDDPRLEKVADRQTGKYVIRVGTRPGLDVTVAPDGEVAVAGTVIGAAPSTAHATNLACAVGVGLALDVDPATLAAAFASLPELAHRRSVGTGSSGVHIVDDTFNSNPAGARAALATLAGLGVSGRKVIVTPGMVELGRRQYDENRIFGAQAAAVSDMVIVVGRTNRSALLEGATESNVEVMVVDHRDEAVEWVRANLGSDDAVLYENDLPDHYP